jgi:hypothetical protein
MLGFQHQIRANANRTQPLRQTLGDTGNFHGSDENAHGQSDMPTLPAPVRGE